MSVFQVEYQITSAVAFDCYRCDGCGLEYRVSKGMATGVNEYKPGLPDGWGTLDVGEESLFRRRYDTPPKRHMCSSCISKAMK